MLSLTACKHTVSLGPLPTRIAVSNVRSVATFQRVQVEGLVNVNLFTGEKKAYVVLKGDPRDVAYVTLLSERGLLHINMGQGFPHYGPVHIDIHTQYLTSFTYRGTGTVIGKDIHTKGLDLVLANQGRTLLQGQIALRKVEITGPGYTQLSGLVRSYVPPTIKIVHKAKVRLAGMFPLANITLEDNSWLSAYWVNSPSLTVCAKDKAYMQLAGSVDLLNIELKDNARLNARYLRAKRVFVKTFGHAVAEISAVQHQHVLASDDSNVYFYHIPISKADFMAINGSVLDMREWSPFMQEYDRYNK